MLKSLGTLIYKSSMWQIIIKPRAEYIECLAFTKAFTVYLLNPRATDLFYFKNKLMNCIC